MTNSSYIFFSLKCENKLRSQTHGRTYVGVARRTSLASKMNAGVGAGGGGGKLFYSTGPQGNLR